MAFTDVVSIIVARRAAISESTESRCARGMVSRTVEGF